MKKIFLALLVLMTGLLFSAQSYAQNAQLSIQGILKKADGKAVDDGTYTLKFKLYTLLEGGVAIWNETQSAVEVASGIYSVQIGAQSPFTVPFDQPYFLGVSVGNNSEMTPRMPLTSAPYALSLRGQNNQFPSIGLVVADAITVAGNEQVSGKLSVNTTVSPTHSVNVTGGYLARAGAPGSNGANNNGYAFQNEKATGIFSDNPGIVDVYSSGNKVVEVVNAGIQVNGELYVTTQIFAPAMSTGSGVAVQLEGNKLVRNTSSARYKENITDLNENYSLLLQAQPKKYTRPGKPNNWEIGFIAEEFDALGLKPLVIYDELGRPDGLYYDKIVTYIVPLLREQSEKISAQAQKIAALEAENAALRNMFSSLRADVDALKTQR